MRAIDKPPPTSSVQRQSIQRQPVAPQEPERSCQHPESYRPTIVRVGGPSGQHTHTPSLSLCAPAECHPGPLLQPAWPCPKPVLPYPLITAANRTPPRAARQRLPNIQGSQSRTAAPAYSIRLYFHSRVPTSCSRGSYLMVVTTSHAHAATSLQPHGQIWVHRDMRQHAFVDSLRTHSASAVLFANPLECVANIHVHVDRW